MPESQSIKNVAIVGSSALGRQLAHHVSQVGVGRVVGFFDDFAVGDSEVLGATKDIPQRFATGNFDLLCIGVGDKAMQFRHHVFSVNQGRIPFASIRHPSAVVDPSATVGEGCVLLAQSVVDQNVCLGGNCFLSLSATVSHDSSIGNSSYLAPRATVCGNCKIGERVFLGAGCIIRDGITICSDAIVGAGAVVVKDIVVPGVYFGNPARKRNED